MLPRSRPAPGERRPYVRILGDAVLHEFLAQHRDALIERARGRAASRRVPLASAAELETGIPLFLGDFPRCEDVTPDVRLYDLGTEYDQELDVGLDTGSQQTMPNSGRVDGKTNVREVTLDRYATPINQHIRVTLTPVDKITN